MAGSAKTSSAPKAGPRGARDPAGRTPASAANEIALLRRRLAEAEARAARCAEAEARAREELDVYREEATQQTQQLVEAYDALETSHERYLSLYDYAPVAFVSLDRKGVIEELNLAAADMLGVERERLAKLPLVNYVDPASRRPFLDHLLRCRRRQTPGRTELTLRTRKGEALPVLLATWFSVPRGEAEWEFRSALLDLSDRKAAEAREQTYHQHLSSLASELSLAEERERRRIAVELHDNLSQNLALIKMKLGMLRQKAAAPDVRGGLEEVTRLLDPVLERTRSLTFELSPPVLYELGLEEALEWLAERAANQHGLAVRFIPSQKSPANLPVPHDVAVLLFQAVRELLMNVAKHAHASLVTLRATRPYGDVQVTVSDNGRGFDPAKLSPPRPGGKAGGNGVPGANPAAGGFGLFSIRTRLEHMGGRMGIRSSPGAGSEIALTVPLATTGTDRHAQSGGGGASGRWRFPEIGTQNIPPRHSAPGPGTGAEQRRAERRRADQCRAEPFPLEKGHRNTSSDRS